MPTYEYRCTNGHTFERFYRTISAATSELECPECGATAQRQISGGAGFAFKGSGFYLTDYGRNAHRTPGPAKKSDAEGTKAGDSKSSSADPKPKPDAATPKTPKPKSE